MWSTIGWIGNACFFTRFLVQWRAAEKAGRVVTPSSFWWLSLIGSLCLLGYLGWRSEAILFAGALVNTAIYARNLHWVRARGRATPVPANLTMPIAIACLVTLGGGTIWQVLEHQQDGESPHGLWLVVVLFGQTLWTSRFLIQWLDLETKRESRLPPTFWWVSLAGNLSLLAYALQRGDAVLIAGYAIGPIVQIRNLILGRQDRRRRREARARAREEAAAGASAHVPCSDSAPRS